VGHVYADVTLRGARGEIVLQGVLVDTGATYTVLERDALERVGAWPIPHRLRLELGDGRAVEADVYAVIVCVEGRCAPTLAASFRGARNVLGVRTLEDLGLRVDPASGKLEPVRPAGVALL
jgi:predicted aspartyl protease